MSKKADEIIESEDWPGLGYLQQARQMTFNADPDYQGSQNERASNFSRMDTLDLIALISNVCKHLPAKKEDQIDGFVILTNEDRIAPLTFFTNNEDATYDNIFIEKTNNDNSQTCSVIAPLLAIANVVREEHMTTALKGIETQMQTQARQIRTDYDRRNSANPSQKLECYCPVYLNGHYTLMAFQVDASGSASDLVLLDPSSTSKTLVERGERMSVGTGHQYLPTADCGVYITEFLLTCLEYGQQNGIKKLFDHSGENVDRKLFGHTALDDVQKLKQIDGDTKYDGAQIRLARTLNAKDRVEYINKLFDNNARPSADGGKKPLISKSFIHNGKISYFIQGGIQDGKWVDFPQHTRFSEVNSAQMVSLFGKSWIKQFNQDYVDMCVWNNNVTIDGRTHSLGDMEDSFSGNIALYISENQNAAYRAPHTLEVMNGFHNRAKTFSIARVDDASYAGWLDRKSIDQTIRKSLDSFENLELDQARLAKYRLKKQYAVGNYVFGKWKRDRYHRKEVALSSVMREKLSKGFYDVQPGLVFDTIVTESNIQSALSSVANGRPYSNARQIKSFKLSGRK